MNKKSISAVNLAAVLVTTGIGFVACSDNDIVTEEATRHQGYNLTVIAGKDQLVGDDSKTPASRATFVEEDGAESYYKWEAGDELAVFKGTKFLGKVKFVSAFDSEGRNGKFTGNFTAGYLTAADFSGELRFAYLGKNVKLSYDADGENSDISIPLWKQGGSKADIDDSSVLYGKGTLTNTSGNEYTTGSTSIQLKNAMGVYHFRVLPPSGAGQVKSLRMLGEGIYGAAKFDFATEKAIPDESHNRTDNFVWNLPSSAKKTTGGRNEFAFYYVLAPGNFTPQFDISYTGYDNNLSANGLTGNPEKLPAGEVYYTTETDNVLIKNQSGALSEFTASNGNTYYFTNGNLLYNIPIKESVGEKGGHEFNAVANTLSRGGSGSNGAKNVAIVVRTEKKLSEMVPGSYWIAPEQWSKYTRNDMGYASFNYVNWHGLWYNGNGGDFTNNVATIDLFARGNADFPHQALPSSGKTDYGTKVFIDDQKTVMPTSDELLSIMNRKFPNSEVYMSTKAWVDINGNGTFDQGTDIGGVVVFPDGMTETEAMSCFATTPVSRRLENSVGFNAGPWGSATTKTQNKLKMDAIRNKGILFLPAVGAAELGSTSWKMRKMDGQSNSNLTHDAYYMSIGGKSGFAAYAYSYGKNFYGEVANANDRVAIRLALKKN